MEVMPWEQIDKYHWVKGDWTVSLAIVDGEERFLVWLGRGMPPAAKMMPYVFDTKKEAAAWVRSIETGKPSANLSESTSERTGTYTGISAPLTQDQRELL